MGGVANVVTLKFASNGANLSITLIAARWESRI